MDLTMCISVSSLVNLREILHEQTFEARPQLAWTRFFLGLFFLSR